MPPTFLPHVRGKTPALRRRLSKLIEDEHLVLEDDIEPVVETGQKGPARLRKK